MYKEYYDEVLLSSKEAVVVIECAECKKQFTASQNYCSNCGAPNASLGKKSEDDFGGSLDSVLAAWKKTYGGRDGWKVKSLLVLGAVVLIGLFIASKLNSRANSYDSGAPSNSIATVHAGVLTTSRPDTVGLSKSIDSIMRAIPLSSISKTPRLDLTVPAALIKGLASNPARTAWLAEAEKRLAQAKPTTTPIARAATQSSAPTLGCSNYQSLVANVSPGKELFLASDCTPIGKIADIQDDYNFPDGTARDAILISFKDGSADWVPRKTAQRIYVTR